MPALPVVHWLREHSPDIAGYTLPMLVHTPAGADAAAIAATLQTVLDHHAALRMRLTRIASVLWSLETTPAGSVRAADLLRTVTLPATGTDPDGASGELRAAVAAEFAAARDRLDPDTGVMMRGVWFDGGPGAPGRLLLAVHHLVVDGVSWRILFEDLAAAWRGEPLEPVGTSLRAYAKAVTDQAQGPDRLRELTHWAATLAPGADLLPGATVGGTARQVVTRLTAAETAPLLTTVPAAARADVADVLLAALRIAVDSPADLLVDVERHGREDLGARLDLSRTVGWFTSVQPVRLSAGTDGWDVVRHVKERLREAPDGGLGHGLLRYLNAQVAPILARMAAPQVLFNYFGRFPAATGADWTPAAELPELVNGGIAPSHLLQVDAVCEDTPDGPRLRVTWTWSEGGLAEEDVRALGDRWAAALRDLAADESPGLTPSDLTILALGREDILRVEAAAGGPVADIWPLSPLQEGLYFHSSYDAGAIDLYTAQDFFDLATVDLDRLRVAGRALLARNPSVRAGFTSDGLASPVQFVAAAPELPITEVDLSGLDPESQRSRVAELMAADRTRRFDLARPPLCRLLLLRLGDTDRLVVSHHLILWDGWSEACSCKSCSRCTRPAARAARPPAPTGTTSRGSPART
ncbi:condensation domain-containing protein [Longispora sp. K20-0274]|uniref:condensation domain-containing protein n=1 Tax=Longispora sp. K20-0274 TaxID=3088255 RepID=UPI00399C2CDD